MFYPVVIDDTVVMHRLVQYFMFVFSQLFWVYDDDMVWL